MTADPETAIAAEMIADMLGLIADDKQDEELVPLGWWLDQVRCELGLDESRLSEADRDVWMPAGEVRRRLRRFRGAIARGEIA